MKRIAIEEHFHTEEYVAFLKSRNDSLRLEVSEDKKGNKTERVGNSLLPPWCS